MTVRLTLALLAVSLSLIIRAQTADAHTLAKDGRISAFLHIDPDDRPIPGRVNTIHFYFDDQDFRFSMEGCDCYAKVNEGKKVLYKGGLPAAYRRVGILKVYLPINNFSYDVVVNGTPKTAGFFQPFTLKFDIDVGHPPPSPPPSQHGYYWLLVLPLAAGGYWLFRRLHGRAIIEP